MRVDSLTSAVAASQKISASPVDRLRSAVAESMREKLWRCWLAITRKAHVPISHVTLSPARCSWIGTRDLGGDSPVGTAGIELRPPAPTLAAPPLPHRIISHQLLLEPRHAHTQAIPHEVELDGQRTPTRARDLATPQSSRRCTRNSTGASPSSRAPIEHSLPRDASEAAAEPTLIVRPSLQQGSLPGTGPARLIVPPRSALMCLASFLRAQSSVRSDDRPPKALPRGGPARVRPGSENARPECVLTACSIGPPAASPGLGEADVRVAGVRFRDRVFLA